MTAVVFVIMRSHHLIAAVPLWVILAPFLGGAAISIALEHMWSSSRSNPILHLRVIFETVTTTTVIYASGWGPTLAIGYVFGAILLIRSAGSRATRSVLTWSVLGIAAGQAAVYLHVAPSKIAEPAVHGLAVLAMLGCGYVIHLLGASTREKESAEQELRAKEERFRSLVSNATDIIAVVDAGGEVGYVSPGVQHVLGYTPEEYMTEKGFA
ncbi:MAG: PAS domain S-box protein, partial [Actinobacteria bacterium]|nr:PAS domain S-box protein [Actinomycetota bacterium]